MHTPDTLRPLGVLVVDDEPAVRGVLARGLAARGFAVWAAAGGVAAVEVISRYPGQIDAALLDLRMPGMSGLETAAALRQVRPGLPCCLMAGYLDKASEGLIGVFDIDLVLLKPFSPQEAGEALQNVLVSRV